MENMGLIPTEISVDGSIYLQLKVSCNFLLEQWLLKQLDEVDVQTMCSN